VQIITTEEEQRERGLRMGAMGVLTKPVKTKEELDEVFVRLKQFTQPHIRSILLVEVDEAARNSEIQWLTGDGVEIIPTSSAADALMALNERNVDLIVLGLEMPDRKGFDLVDEIKDRPECRDVPMIISVSRELSKKEELTLKRLVQTMSLKEARSPERLIDEASLFLHQAVSAMPEAQQRVLHELHHDGKVLAEKKVLIVDDDIRNIFAMTSLLEPHRMEICSAETGRSAIEMLQTATDIDVVLMDIMMPDMDGYDTMRAIRKLAKFRSLPIIALTAKAMKGDREKCIEAGASDYISKPVDPEQLLSLLRIWLYR